MSKPRKIYLNYLTILMTLAILFPVYIFNVYSANSCRVSFSDPSCNVGNNVTVSVSVTGDVAAADINLVYSTDYLEFVSVSGDLSYGGSGSVRLYNMYNSGSGNMNFSITFKARAAGTGSITVSSYDIVDGNGDPMDVTCGSSTVTITNLSDNSSLSSLSISPGSLSPAFSPSTTNYSVSVSNSVSSMTVSAIPADSQARASVSGNSNLKVGSNTITITVTAGNGSTSKYYINVNRAPAPGGTVDKPNTSSIDSETSSSSEEEKVLYAKFKDGTELELTDFNDEDVPPGFEIISYNYKNTDISAVSHDGENGVAFYLKGNDKYPTGFYFYDKTADIVYPFPYLALESSYILVDFPADLKIPDNYTAAVKEVGGNEINVLIPNDVKEINHYLLCAINKAGIKNIYLYDIEESTLQRYDFAVISDKETPAISPEEPSDTSSSDTNSTATIVGTGIIEPISSRFPAIPDFFNDTGVLQYIVAGALLLLLILLIPLIILCVKNRNLKRDLKLFIIDSPDEYDEYDEYDDSFMNLNTLESAAHEISEEKSDITVEHTAETEDDPSGIEIDTAANTVSDIENIQDTEPESNTESSEETETEVEIISETDVSTDANIERSIETESLSEDSAEENISVTKPEAAVSETENIEETAVSDENKDNQNSAE